LPVLRDDGPRACTSIRAARRSQWRPAMKKNDSLRARKLNLSSQTIRLLAEAQIEPVRGGATPSSACTIVGYRCMYTTLPACG
jgi:hypothetical protein